MTEQNGTFTVTYDCNEAANADSNYGLRVAALFAILAVSTLGGILPWLCRTINLRKLLAATLAMLVLFRKPGHDFFVKIIAQTRRFCPSNRAIYWPAWWRWVSLSTCCEAQVWTLKTDRAECAKRILAESRLQLLCRVCFLFWHCLCRWGCSGYWICTHPSRCSWWPRQSLPWAINFLPMGIHVCWCILAVHVCWRILPASLHSSVSHNFTKSSQSYQCLASCTFALVKTEGHDSEGSIQFAS